MKLKYKFVVREIDGTYVAVAVGKDNAKFNGMIKLNTSGVFIFNLLKNREISFEEIVNELVKKYDVSEEIAQSTVKVFIEAFRKNDLIEE